MKFTFTDMALLPNGTMQDGTLAQAMLTAFFLNLVYAFVIMIDALSFICSKRSINCIKNLLYSLRKKSFVERLKVPQHLAIAFGVEEVISLAFLSDIILYSAQHGVRQITFYDPEGRIESIFDDLELRFSKAAIRKFLRQKVIFNREGTAAAYTGDLQVYALSKRHGKQLIAEICAELSQGPEEITADTLRHRLKQKNVHEVDFLVTVGCSNTTCDFPPWSLRLTEILNFERLDDHLREQEFADMLRSFSNRDRRMGY